MYVGDGYVNDANYKPLAVYTHSDTISNYVWVVPGDYEPQPSPEPSPSPTPTPSPTPEHVSDCKTWRVQKGDTMGKIMKACKGYVQYGQAMNNYAKTWYSTIIKPGQSVYDGWASQSGVGLFVGDIIDNRK